MKNKSVFFLFTFFLLLFNQHFYAQKRDVSSIGSRNAYAEKIYLQLSGSVFTTKNTIWYKAIVTDLAHLPTKLSAILYVELIDFDKKIIDKKKLKIEFGSATSSFELNENLPSGRYLIRAYTEWNKNFENEFISQKYIEIINPKKVVEKEDAIRDITLTETASKQFELSAKAFPKVLNPKYNGKLTMYIYADSKIDSIEIKKDKEDNYSFKYQLPKDVVKARMEMKLDSVKLRNNNLGFVKPFSKTVAVNKDFLDLQFFPEGGKLVDGLTSSIAFKALDYTNKGIAVTGNIVDQDNAIVMPFQSNLLGMGVTFLNPDANKKYYASIKNKLGVEYKYALPQISKTGVVINVKELKNYIVVTLNSNNSAQEELNLKVQSRGVEYENFTSQFKNGVDNNAIDKGTLPEGIIKFTVLNKEGQIQCERLFFNYKEDENISISAIPDFKQSNQRDKIVFNLETKVKDNSAIKSNLSMLVINKDQLENNNFSSNILSYFLLTSELRGAIEQASSYFNLQNKTRKRDMDALLLTQGWSNYKYENSKFKTDFKFLPEKKLTVSGSVRNLLNTKKLITDPIELTMVYGPLNVMTQKVDSTGHFRFQFDDFYKDDLRVIIQSKNENGKKKDFLIDLDKAISPAVDYIDQEDTMLTDKNGVAIKKIAPIIKGDDKTKTVNGAIALNEVKIANMSPIRKKMIDAYGVPDKIIDGKELLSKVKKWHSGLYSLLQSDYPDDIIINSSGDTLSAKVIGTDRTIVVIDGIRVSARDYLYLEGLPIEDIKSVEIIKLPKRSKYYQDDIAEAADYDIEQQFTPTTPNLNRTSVISIYTYAGKGLFGAQRTQGITKGTVPGFATKREFYAPKYDTNSEKNNGIPDFRSVIQWVPNINTDAEGKAQVTLYNSDDVGEMIVIFEGMSAEGKIGYYETNYTVEDKSKK